MKALQNLKHDDFNGTPKQQKLLGCGLVSGKTSTLSIPDRRAQLDRVVLKKLEALLSSPYNKAHNILGSIFGAPCC